MDTALMLRGAPNLNSVVAMLRQAQSHRSRAPAANGKSGKRIYRADPIGFRFSPRFQKRAQTPMPQ